MKTNAIVLGLVAASVWTGSAFVNKPAEVPTVKTAAKATTYAVDTEQSVINWNGKKVTGEHYGTVKINKGTLSVDGNKLTGGTVEADMKTLTSLDLKDNENMYNRLVTHLKSDDFFSVEKHPVATFVITKATPKGGSQYDLTGNLTIKGITQPVTFPATVNITKNGVEANGKMSVDRTKYDIKFRSKSFFENLGDKAIYDDFTLEVKLLAKKGTV